MPITLNGTTGIQNVLGSASAPADTNTTTPTTGVYYPSATTWGVSTAGTNALYIDASQNVGIGTTSPNDKLNVVTSAVNGGVTISGSTDPQYYLSSSGSNTARFKISDSSSMVQTGSWSNIAVGFYTNGSNRMNIANSGQVGINVTASSGNTLNVQNITGDNVVYFHNSSQVGVYLQAGQTSFSTSSDETIKDIIEPITGSVDKLTTLRTVIGKYKTDVEGTRRPFLIAQDVQKILPEAVNTTPEGHLGLNYNDLIPLLVNAISELKAEFEAYKAAHP